MEQCFLLHPFGTSGDGIGHGKIAKVSGNPKRIHVEAAIQQDTFPDLAVVDTASSELGKVSLDRVERLKKSWGVDEVQVDTRGTEEMTTAGETRVQRR